MNSKQRRIATRKLLADWPVDSLVAYFDHAGCLHYGRVKKVSAVWRSRLIIKVIHLTDMAEAKHVSVQPNSLRPIKLLRIFSGGPMNGRATSSNLAIQGKSVTASDTGCNLQGDLYLVERHHQGIDYMRYQEPVSAPH